MKSTINGLKLALKVGIGHNSDLLALTPRQLLETINPKIFTNVYETADRRQQEDALYIVEQLQECFNGLLDARRHLIKLGLYELDVDYEEKGIPTKPKVQVGVRDEIPAVLEEDEYPDSHPIQIPPNETMEI